MLCMLGSAFPLSLPLFFICWQIIQPLMNGTLDAAPLWSNLHVRVELSSLSFSLSFPFIHRMSRGKRELESKRERPVSGVTCTQRVRTRDSERWVSKGEKREEKATIVDSSFSNVMPSVMNRHVNPVHKYEEAFQNWTTHTQGLWTSNPPLLSCLLIWETARNKWWKWWFGGERAMLPRDTHSVSERRTSERIPENEDHDDVQDDDDASANYKTARHLYSETSGISELSDDVTHRVGKRGRSTIITGQLQKSILSRQQTMDKMWNGRKHKSKGYSE